jgi:hypothetical protein
MPAVYVVLSDISLYSLTYLTDAQLDCFKNVKIYMRGTPTYEYFVFSQPLSGSYYMCFAK